jgi:hypothetical protein
LGAVKHPNQMKHLSLLTKNGTAIPNLQWICRELTWKYQDMNNKVSFVFCTSKQKRLCWSGAR